MKGPGCSFRPQNPQFSALVFAGSAVSYSVVFAPVCAAAVAASAAAAAAAAAAVESTAAAADTTF